MTIEEIEDMWAEDSKIDEFDLSAASRASALLHSKYYKIYNRACRHLSKLLAEKERLILLKNDYYLGNLDKETLQENGWSQNKRTILKTDIPMFINADRDIINMNLKIAEMKQITGFLESIIKSINNRQFIIKNIIDHERFINGS